MTNKELGLKKILKLVERFKEHQIIYKKAEYNETQTRKHHLILLSILQTCKYQEINFFEFLKSGKKTFILHQKNNLIRYYNLSQIFAKFGTK